MCCSVAAFEGVAVTRLAFSPRLAVGPSDTDRTGAPARLPRQRRFPQNASRILTRHRDAVRIAAERCSYNRLLRTDVSSDHVLGMPLYSTGYSGSVFQIAAFQIILKSIAGSVAE